jgi:hypothetical protein
MKKARSHGTLLLNSVGAKRFHLDAKGFDVDAKCPWGGGVEQPKLPSTASPAAEAV